VANAKKQQELLSKWIRAKRLEYAAIVRRRSNKGKSIRRPDEIGTPKTTIIFLKKV